MRSLGKPLARIALPFRIIACDVPEFECTFFKTQYAEIGQIADGTDSESVCVDRIELMDLVDVLVCVLEEILRFPSDFEILLRSQIVRFLSQLLQMLVRMVMLGQICSQNGSRSHQCVNRNRIRLIEEHSNCRAQLATCGFKLGYTDRHTCLCFAFTVV
ncbi:hypothetical protein CFB41_12645 [Burkholderia sp. AU33803]|nr:hypothetical protein CFB41_12645 [Burkholderia sp. AU33803]PRD85707.1 hypothetical protein C6P88_34265 [Burkholderia contaminans]